MSESEKTLDEFVAGLDMADEQRSERRVETWLFVRALLILLFVIAVVVIRSLLL